MSQTIKKYISSTAIAYMVIVLYSSVSNLLTGHGKGGYTAALLELLAFLIMAQFIDALIYRIEFKSFAVHFLVETAVLYPLSMLAAYVGRWFEFYLSNIIWNTGIYLLIMCVVHLYFYWDMKSQSDELNRILKENQTKGGSVNG